MVANTTVPCTRLEIKILLVAVVTYLSSQTYAIVVTTGVPSKLYIRSSSSLPSVLVPRFHTHATVTSVVLVSLSSKGNV